MKTIMTIAAGVALGYFAYQYFISHSKGKISGRLHKSTRDKKVAGVCGGIGEYFNIDPTLVRLGFVALSFMAGGGLLVYILATIIIPAEGRE